MSGLTNRCKQTFKIKTFFFHFTKCDIFDLLWLMEKMSLNLWSAEESYNPIPTTPSCWSKKATPPSELTASGPGWIYVRFSKPSYSNNDMHFWRLLMSHDRSGGTICSMCATSTVTQIVKKINPKETDCVFLGTNTMGHANGVQLIKMTSQSADH